LRHRNRFPPPASVDKGTVPMDTAQSLAAALAGEKTERLAAYAALEATQDVSLGAACVESLLVCAGKPESEVDAAEYRRCMLALAHLAQLDGLRIGAEYAREMRCLSSFAKGNALDAACAKPVEQLSKDDARTLAAWLGADATMYGKGFDVWMDAAGIGLMEFLTAWPSQDCAWNALRQDEPKAMRIMDLMLELLRDDRAELSEAEVASAWSVIKTRVLESDTSNLSRHAVQAGAIGLAIEELRRGSPADWLSISRNRSGRFAMVLGCYSDTLHWLAAEDMHLVAATPQMLDVLLEGLKVYEEASSAEDVHSFNAVWLTGCLYGTFEVLDAGEGRVRDQARTAVRGAASGIRYLFDHPLIVAKDLGLSTSTFACWLAASVFGRDEEGSEMELRQRDVDECALMVHTILDGSFSIVPLLAKYSQMMLNILCGAPSLLLPASCCCQRDQIPSTYYRNSD
jgi:hypothetical protein